MDHRVSQRRVLKRDLDHNPNLDTLSVVREGESNILVCSCGEKLEDIDEADKHLRKTYTGKES